METRAVKTKLDSDDDDVDLLHPEVILPFVLKSSLQTATIWNDWHHKTLQKQVPPSSLQTPVTSECKWCAD